MADEPNTAFISSPPSKFPSVQPEKNMCMTKHNEESYNNGYNSNGKLPYFYAITAAGKIHQVILKNPSILPHHSKILQIFHLKVLMLLVMQSCQIVFQLALLYLEGSLGFGACCLCQRTSLFNEGQITVQDLLWEVQLHWKRNTNKCNCQ